MSEFMYDKEKYIEEGKKIIFENNTDSSFGVETGIIFHKSGLYDVDISNNHVVVSKVNERKAIEEAYQKGFETGKARNESGCIGCRYDDGTTEHSPCDYCCNAYSNQWSAKPCSDEIEVGDEVTYTFIDGAEIPPFVVFAIKDNGENRRYYEGYRRTDGKWVGGGLDYKKTGLHFPQVAELFKAMKEGAGVKE